MNIDNMNADRKFGADALPPAVSSLPQSSMKPEESTKKKRKNRDVISDYYALIEKWGF